MKVVWAIGAAQERYMAKTRDVARTAMLYISDPNSNDITLNQAKCALDNHLMSLKVMSVGLDSSLQILMDPSSSLVQVRTVVPYTVIVRYTSLVTPNIA